MSDDDRCLWWREPNIPFITTQHGQIVIHIQRKKGILTELHGVTIASWCCYDEVRVCGTVCCWSQIETVGQLSSLGRKWKKRKRRTTTRPVNSRTWVAICRAGEVCERSERRDLSLTKNGDALPLGVELKSRCSIDNRGEQRGKDATSNQHSCVLSREVPIISGANTKAPKSSASNA